jgi:hypothetical protein
MGIVDLIWIQTGKRERDSLKDMVFVITNIPRKA